MPTLLRRLSDWGIRSWILLDAISFIAVSALTIIEGLHYHDQAGRLTVIILIAAYVALFTVAYFLLSRGKAMKETTIFYGGVIFSLMLPGAWTAFGVVLSTGSLPIGIPSALGGLVCLYLLLRLGLNEGRRYSHLEKHHFIKVKHSKRMSAEEERFQKISRLREKEAQVYKNAINKIERKP